MRRTILLLSVLLSGSVSYASEFYHQAPSGELEFTATLQSEYALSRFSNGAKSEGFDLILGFQAERGIGEKFAVGSWVGFGYGEVTQFGQDITSDGIEDLQIYFKAFQPVSSGSFRYGLSLSVSLEDREVEFDGYTNRFTGGIGSRLYLGYEHIEGPHTLGFRVSQQIGLEDRIEASDTGGDIEVAGSEDFEVAFYYERVKEDSNYWGGQFSYTLTSDREANGVSSENMSPVLRFQAYRPTSIGSAVLVPKLSAGFGTADNVNGAELDEYTEIRLSADYRF